MTESIMLLIWLSICSIAAFVYDWKVGVAFVLFLLITGFLTGGANE